MIWISFWIFILQMNYEDFCHIASVCTEQIGPKCRRFFSPSNFMKFEKDESGRIAILPFYLYVMRTVGLCPLFVMLLLLYGTFLLFFLAISSICMNHLLHTYLCLVTRVTVSLFFYWQKLEYKLQLFSYLIVVEPFFGQHGKPLSFFLPLPPVS